MRCVGFFFLLHGAWALSALGMVWVNDEFGREDGEVSAVDTVTRSSRLCSKLN